MATFLMTWNPDSKHGWGHDALTREILTPFKKTGAVETYWRISSYKKAKAGDQIVLLKQGPRPTGIFGFGKIIKDPEFKKGRAGTKQAWRAKIQITKIIDPDQNFFFSEYECREILGDSLVNAHASGCEVPDPKAKKLHSIFVD